MAASERLEYLVSRAAENTVTDAEIEELRAMLLQDPDGNITKRTFSSSCFNNIRSSDEIMPSAPTTVCSPMLVFLLFVLVTGVYTACHSKMIAVFYHGIVKAS